eukprot:tig00000178_g12780.t1
MAPAPNPTSSPERAPPANEHSAAAMFVHGHAIPAQPDVAAAVESEGRSAAPAAAVAPRPEQPDRTVRVFLSSTFKDMEEERRAIFASAVPRLRRALDARGLFFVPVDLRWGITREAAESGEVLRLCLEEVARSKYFIGFLKARYGWHQAPDGPTDVLLAASFARAEGRFPFVRGYADRSATELEIIFGALVDASVRSRL